MSIRRAPYFGLIVGLLMMACAATVQAQVRIPSESTIYDLQFFHPANVTGFDQTPYLNEGFFFSYEGVAWSLSRPKVAIVGAPGQTRQVFDQNQFRFFTEGNSMSTSPYEDLIHGGHRAEFGYMRDNCGWFVSVLGLHDRTQEFVHNDASVVFNDPQRIFAFSFIQGPNGIDLDLDGDRVYGRDGEDLGTPVGLVGGVPAIFPAPHPDPAQPAFDGLPGSVGRPAHPFGSLGDGVSPGFYLPYDGIPDSFPNGSVPDSGDLVPTPSDFDFFVARNYTEMWGVELMGARRLERISFGGHWELFAGVRYIRFDEKWWVQGEGGELADFEMLNKAENNIVGPQIGARWFKRCWRFHYSTEMRLMPGLNAQAVRIRSTIADSPTSAISFQKAGNNSFHETEFAPVGEFRMNIGFQLTRAIAFKGGWTAMYIDGVARPSNMVNYILPTLDIVRENNRDKVFTQGINFGVEINR